MWKLVIAVALGMCVAAAGFSGSSVAEAQRGPDREASTSPGADRGRAASEAFREGSSAADELRWGDAERHFERAYALSGLPEALYMRGVALRALDRHVEARDTFLRVVAALEADPAILAENTDIATEARNLAEQSRSRIARLDIGDLDPASILRVDGRRMAVVAPRTTVEVDPGAHTVVVERDGYDTFVWTNDAEAGARVVVNVVMSTLIVEMRAAEVDPRPARRRRALVGAIVSFVVIAAAATVIGVRLGSDVTQIDPTAGPDGIPNTIDDPQTSVRVP